MVEAGLKPDRPRRERAVRRPAGAVWWGDSYRQGGIIMNTTIAAPGQLVIGRRRLGGLIVGVAVTSASLSGVVVGIASTDGAPHSDAARDRSASQPQHTEFVEWAQQASPEELAGAFNYTSYAVPLADAWRARSAEFVEWADRASPEELAWAFDHTSYEFSPNTP
jgi:hypothetical protein